MSDRELLEFAAKAAGIGIIDGHQHDVGSVRLYTTVGAWNPLNDDGDALRLAVTLRIDVCTEENDAHPTEDRQICHVNAWPQGGAAGCCEDRGDDPYAATRRAIVRAAAEIGRNLK
jgi:hypothetical protein